MSQPREQDSSCLTGIFAAAIPLGFAFVSWYIPSCIQQQKAQEQHELLVLGGSAEELGAAQIAYNAELTRLRAGLDSFVAAGATVLAYGNDSLAPTAEVAPMYDRRRFHQTDPYDRTIPALQRRTKALAAWRARPDDGGLEVVGRDHDSVDLRLALPRSDTAAPIYRIRLRYRLRGVDSARASEYLASLPPPIKHVSGFEMPRIDPREPQSSVTDVSEAALATWGPSNRLRGPYVGHIDPADTAQYFTFSPYGHRPSDEEFARAVEHFKANFLGGVEVPEARVRRIRLVYLPHGDEAE